MQPARGRDARAAIVPTGAGAPSFHLTGVAVADWQAVVDGDPDTSRPGAGREAISAAELADQVSNDSAHGR